MQRILVTGISHKTSSKQPCSWVLIHQITLYLLSRLGHLKMKTREDLFNLKEQKVKNSSDCLSSLQIFFLDTKSQKINGKYTLADVSRKSEFSETPL